MKKVGAILVIAIFLASSFVATASIGVRPVETETNSSFSLEEYLDNLDEEQIDAIMESGTEEVVETTTMAGYTVTFSVGSADVVPPGSPQPLGVTFCWSKVHAMSGPFEVQYVMARAVFIYNWGRMLAVYDHSAAWAAWPMYRIDSWSHFKEKHLSYGYVPADAIISGIWWWQHWSPCCWVVGYPDGTWTGGYHW